MCKVDTTHLQTGEVDVVVFGEARLERLERNAGLADEVEPELVLVEDRQPQRLVRHVVVGDAVVRQRLVPLGVQGLLYCLTSKFCGLLKAMYRITLRRIHQQHIRKKP